MTVGGRAGAGAAGSRLAAWIISLARIAPVSSGLRRFDEADVAVGFQHRPPDFVYGRDLAKTGLLGEVIEGQPLSAHVAVDELAVLHEHDRFALEKRAERVET
jgi:hypothetical protein